MLSNRFLSIIYLLSIVTLTACSNPEKENRAQDNPEKPVNPAAPGFSLENSDPKAIAIADSVMKAMGGRENWDNTRFFAWNFFGARDLVWDKYTGKVRITSPGDSSIYLINVFEDTGKVIYKGKEVTEKDSLTIMIKRGKGIWINDSYWLVMPFKLKDSGVTLKYLREEVSTAGDTMDVLQLTFDSVGNTPNNKYEVSVDRSDYLIYKWAYFREAAQDTADYTWPFDNYQQQGKILLSSNRSDGKGPKNVQVFESLPEEIFTSFEKISLD